MAVHWSWLIRAFTTSTGKDPEGLARVAKMQAIGVAGTARVNARLDLVFLAASSTTRVIETRAEGPDALTLVDWDSRQARVIEQSSVRVTQRATRRLLASKQPSASPSSGEKPNPIPHS